MVNSQVGGDRNTLYTLLLITKILYLPKTNVIKSPDMIDKYMDCIDSFTLIYLIDKLELNNISVLDKIFKNTLKGGAEDTIGETVQDIQTEGAQEPKDATFYSDDEEEQPLSEQPLSETYSEDKSPEDEPQFYSDDDAQAPEEQEQSVSDDEGILSRSKEKSISDTGYQSTLENMADEDEINEQVKTSPELVLDKQLAPKDTNYSYRYEKYI